MLAGTAGAACRVAGKETGGRVLAASGSGGFATWVAGKEAGSGVPAGTAGVTTLAGTGAGGGVLAGTTSVAGKEAGDGLAGAGAAKLAATTGLGVGAGSGQGPVTPSIATGAGAALKVGAGVVTEASLAWDVSVLHRASCSRENRSTVLGLNRASCTFWLWSTSSITASPSSSVWKSSSIIVFWLSYAFQYIAGDDKAARLHPHAVPACKYRLS